MSFLKNAVSEASSSQELVSIFPKCLSELRPILQSQELVMGLVSLIEQEQGQKVRWAERQPLCAKELVQTLFSKKKFDQAVLPFFSICAQDPGLKKALLKIGSYPSSDQKSEKVQNTLEKNIQVLAEHPSVFFELANESINHQNRRLVQALLVYCNSNSEFVQKNLKEFSNLVKRSVHLEDLVVVEYIIDNKLDRFLEKEGSSYRPLNGGLDLDHLLIYKRWNTLDLLVQKGKVSDMKISSYTVENGENAEKIDLLLANGAIVDQPSSYWYEDKKTLRAKRAFGLYEMRKALHADGLSVDYLKTLKTEDLWRWLCFDRDAASVLAKHPDFFSFLFFQQSNPIPNFDRALKAYCQAGIFNPKEHGIPLLFKAICSNDCAMAMALIQHGVPPNGIDLSNGWTGFEAALRSLNLDARGVQLFEFFLNHPTTDCHALFNDGSHPIDVLFQLNIPNKHVILKGMLEKGIALHQVKLSLLERALTVQPYDVPALKLLISHGIALNEQTSSNDSVLHALIFAFAKATGAQREAILQLITHLAVHDPKNFDGLVNNDGKTVLDLAKEMDLPEVVLTLLQVGFKKESSVSVQGSGNSELDLLLSQLEKKGVQVSHSDLGSITRAYRNIDRPATPSELRPWLNLTNFAYFFGDAIDKYGALKSSKKAGESRPGNSFNESGSFLTVLLSVCEKVLGDKEAPKDECEAVAAAKQKLERAVFCSKVLTQCSHSEEFKRRFLPVLSASIEAQIASLPPGETLLIPSGWSGQEGRYHAMLIEVVKNSDGTCSLLVINTDKKNGALLHAQRPTGLKDLINPIRAFDKIPQDKLFDTELIPSLLSLLAHFPEDGANQYGDKDYYHLIFSRLSEYAVALPEDKKLCFITAQRSGTCTIRCALAYLHVFLGTELYRKVKAEIEQIIFYAINDPEFIEKASVNPDFLVHLEHAIERSALHVNKHKSQSDASLAQAKEVAALLSDVETKISVAVESSESSKKASEVVNVAATPLQQAAIKLEESRQKLIHREVKAEPLAPFQPLVPPSIDFSSLSSGEEWIAAIDQLDAFFEKSSQSPMDPNQTVATRLTTEVLSTLTLPSNGVFHPGIDAKTPVGLLSLPEKEVFRQKLGALCQKYATALYNQRSAAAGREVERFAIWYGSHEEPYTETESMEQYLCVNKLFAHYWRLSLELEGEERGPASLSHYGIDTSHLNALKNSIHLPCYSPRTAQQLNELIEFFEQSHPAPDKANRTLLAIGDWSETGMKIVLPLNGSEQNQFGETALCEEWYQRIPNEAWAAIDLKLNSIKGWTKPDIKKLRLAYLFAHPEMLQQKELMGASQDLSKAIVLYSDLRKMAFTCWLFKRASHEDPVCFKEVEWSEESKVLETTFVAKSRVKELQGKAKESKDPFLVGNLGHHMLGGQESALKGSTEQNDYIIHESQRVHFNSRRFYEIAQAEEFAVHRLLCHYQENISDLKNAGDQIFLQLVLFGKEQLAKALRQDPAIGNRVLHLIEQALHEFDLQLQADPTKEELLRGIIFLNAIKLRLDSYLPGSFSEKDRLMLQQEISQRLQAMDVKVSTPQSSAIQSSRYAAANKAELRLLWICAQPSSSWTELKSCEQALAYLAQFEFFVEQLGSDDHAIDPTLRALAYQTVFAHFNELKKAFANPEVLSRAAAQIAGVYGIDIGGDIVINGTFPQVSFVHNERLYEINLLSGIFVRDKAPLVNPMKVLLNSVIREFSLGREEPIEIYVLSRAEDASRFYSRSQGCEYYFTVHKLDERNWETQVEWTRGEETFCYMPPDKVPDELKRIALEQTPKLNNYYYWISKGPSKIAAIIQNRATGVEEVIIYADGSAERSSSKERWNYAAVESVPGLAVLASMQPKEQVAVWEKADLSDTREVHCFGLKDSRGAPFRLEGGRDPGSLNVVNLPGYRLSSEQAVKGLGRHFPYMIVQNEKGKQKAIVPVKIWSEVARGSKDLERSYSCEEIAIDEKGNPAPSGIKQQLLLAYYFIGAKQYDRALGLIKQIDSSRVYTPEELKMLGWIFLHSKTTKDYCPKAVALSLMAARLAKENLENFPDAYPRDGLNPKVTGYYAEPKAWVQFWKGSAPFEKSAAKSQALYGLLAEAFERYYEVSSHCTPEFQVHGNLLTAFQEALWLTDIVSQTLNLTLQRRLKFLLTGQVDPIIKEAKPQFEISFKFAKEMTGFDWLHSIDAGPDEYRPVLAFLNRIRPEKGLKEEFGKLFALATKGTAEEKNALLLFLKDMQHDPNEVNQLIRGILMSQLPPYDSGPISSLYRSYQSQRYDSYRSSSSPEPELTMSQAIVKKVSEIASERHREGPTPSAYRGFYGYSNPEKQLTELVREWQLHFFRSSKATIEEEKTEAIPKIETLLPPLAQQKKEKLVGRYEHGGDVFIAEMNAAAAQLFIPEEKEPSPTAFPPLPPTLQKDPYFQMRGKALRQDIEEGKVQNQSKTRFCLKEKGVDQLLPLQKDLNAKKEKLEEELKVRKADIKEYVKQVRGGSSREIEAQLLRLGKKDVPPELDECIALFVQRDLNLYQRRMPFLSQDDCQVLNNMIGEYLLAATTEQRLTRSLEKLNKVISRSEKGKSLEQPVHDLASEMKKTREFVPSENPEMLVLEYYANISLRKEQRENLIKMITLDAQGKFPPILLQMIMSAGKTSVLGTLLALIKADGYHLSILFTPRSLLDTNAPEMQERNLSFFGQRGHTLTFNRGKAHFNVPHLLRLQHLLLHAIEHREYLILCPETLLSMQNQYIEAREKIYTLRQEQLGATPSQKEKLQIEIQRWEAPAQELKKILHLIRQRGAATFDEIDTQFSPRKELNYPGIETTRLDRISVELVSVLYEIASTDPDFKLMGLNLAENTQSRLVPNQMAAIKPLLAQKMLAAIQSNPLWCQHLGLGIICDKRQIEQLTDYFLNPGSEAPEWIAALHASGSQSDWRAAERLVLIRQEIAQWLPSCWKYSANEHFSRSKEHPNYLAAKPNICASTPNESAEIAHAWELVNKTLQLYVSTGVDLTQTKSIVESLQKLAVIQSRKLGSDSVEKEVGKKSSIFEKTPAVQIFKKAASEAGQQELDLMKLKVTDEEAIKKVQKVLNAGTAESIRMIIQYLNEQVFPELEFHKDQIHNNTANLSGAVDSEQGYSGTTANSFIFSHAYLQDPEKRIVLDKGAYGRVIDTLCRANRTVHTVSPKLKTAEDLMKAIHQRKSFEERNRFHAFIDIGAYFKGHTNTEVASSFLNYFSGLEQSPIEGILYYDDTNNQLACLKKGKKEPIFLDSTEAKTIFAMTGLKKQQLFTFYDQFHTVGSNIIQDPHAKAFYTIGDQTVLRDELQGDMRMRSLLEEQEIEGIIPEDLIPLISHRIEEPIAEKPSIEQILLFGEVNGLLRDREDNLKAFSLKLNAAARKYVLDKLYICDGEEEEPLYAAARTFFIKPMTEELFSQYGGPPQSLKAHKYIEAVMQHFLARIQLIEPYVPQSKVEALKKELSEIAAISESYIPPDIDSRSQGEDNTVEKIADIEKKVDNLNELDLDTQKDLAKDEKPQKAKEIPWNFGSLGDLLQQLYAPFMQDTSLAAEPMFQSLSDVMNTHGDYAIFSDSFTPEFLVSNNFMETVSGQSNLFEQLQKTPYETLLFRDPLSQKLHLLLLTTMEAQSFFKVIVENGGKCPFTLLNGDGSYRAGAPIDPHAPDVQHLIVQMLFFSGRLSVLQEQKWERGLNDYLLVNRAMKRDLFEAVILESKKFQDYEHSMLKRMLNAPSETVSKVDPVFPELKAAYFALRHGNWFKCKESVEKHFSSLAKGRSEELSIVIGIARTLARSAKSPTHAQWGTRLLLEILPYLTGYATRGEYKPIEKMIEALKEPVGDELKKQIIQALMQITEMPAGLIKTAYEYTSCSVIGEKSEVPAVIETLKNSLLLLSQLEQHNLFEDFVAIGGKQLVDSCFPSNNSYRYRNGSEVDRPAVAFEATMTLLRELRSHQDPQADLLLRYATPFLIKHLGVMRENYLSMAEWFNRDYKPHDHEKRVLQFYEEFSGKYCGFCPELDQIFIEQLILPIIQKAHKKEYKSEEYSETEGSYNWEGYVTVLEKTKHPYALEQAENLRLKFERSYGYEGWL